MKYFNLFVILLLLTMGLVSFGFAGKGSKAIQIPDQITQGSISRSAPIDESDKPIDRIKKSSNRSIMQMMSTSKPVSQTMAISGPGMAGTYNIPGSYYLSIPLNDLETAILVLNAVGLADDAEFVLVNSDYDVHPVVIYGTYPNAGTYKLTIKSESPANLHFISTAENGKGISFDGAKNITLEDLNLDWTGAGSVFPASDAFAATIYITNDADNLTFKNLSIQGQVDNPVWADQTDGRPAVFSYTEGYGNTNLTFDGCTVTNGTFGFKFLHGTGDFNSVEHLTITNCKIGGAFGDPLVLGGWGEWMGDVNFTNNIVDGINFLQTYWYNGGTEYCINSVWGLDILYEFGYVFGWYNVGVDEGLYEYNIFRNITGTLTNGDGMWLYAVRVYGINLGFGGSTYFPLFTNNRIYNYYLNDNTATVLGFRGPCNVTHTSIRMTGTMPSGQTTICMNNGGGYTYNCAFSNEMTGGSASARRAINASANTDYNAIYSTGYYVGGYSTMNTAAGGGVNPHGTFGPIYFTDDLHVDTTDAHNPGTVASNMGWNTYKQPFDIDGQARPVNDLVDGGADEFGDVAYPYDKDVFPTFFSTASSIPQGVPQVTTVSVKNNTPYATASFNLHFEVQDPSLTVIFSKDTLITLDPLEHKGISMVQSWTPTVPGSFKLSATTSLAGDLNPANDSRSFTVSVSAPLAITSPKTYTWDASDEGWTRSIDWVRSSTFTKLGGPYSGASMITERPNKPSTYTEGAYANTQGYSTTYPGANILLSPWLNLSGLSGNDLYVSFFLTLRTEPKWDFAILRYTLDGVTWNVLGQENDPNGINWYNSAVYNSRSSGGYDAYHCIDEATWETRYGLGEIPEEGYPIWSSKGDCDEGTPLGPDGWVYNQLKVTDPAIARASVIRFQFIAFSDAATAMDPGGWGIDNFTLSNTQPIFSGGTITGVVFHDANGNATVDAGEEQDGITVTMSAPWIPGGSVSKVTSGGGVYTFTTSDGITLPGNYNIKVNIDGKAWNVPFGIANNKNVYHSADGSTVSQNFGWYGGTISGKKFSDVNDNGSDIEPGEPGLSGWTIELYKDTTAPLTLLATTTTDENGNYSFAVPAYDNGYTIKEVLNTATARQTFPAAPGIHKVVVKGPEPVNITDKNFGNFVLARVQLSAVIDVNGDGIRHPLADVSPLPPGTPNIIYEIYKNNEFIGMDTLSNGIAYKVHTFDLGTYGFKRISPVPSGWMQTYPTIPFDDSLTYVVSASKQNDTVAFLYFKLVTVSGMKFEDLNGNGVKDEGEPGLEGWTITISGTNGGSTVTGPGGTYQFTGIGPGSHTVDEILQDGWVSTYKDPTRTFTLNSGGSKSNLNFGNFKKFTVSGLLFRDRNNNGVQDAGEEGISGHDMTLTGYTNVPTGPNGEFTFTDVGPAPDGLTLSTTAPSGYVFTVPTSGEYAITATSGTDVTGKIFGVFKNSDATTYRTFTSDQFVGAGEAKPTKYKPGKPIPGGPNTADLLDFMLNPKKGGSGYLQVGLSGQLNAGGKEKAYLYVAKQGDAYKTFNGKAGAHSGAARGFDFDVKGKVMMKKWKSMPSDKKNDKLAAELLTLQINLMASLKGHTDAAGNLGALIYTLPGPWGVNKTIDEIADYADGVMTNWEGVPYWVYDSLYNAVSRINGAFATGVMNDTTAGFTAPKMKWYCPKTVYDPSVSWFLAAAVTAPKQRHIDEPITVPDVYALGQNYPNPFNPTTNITFALPTTSVVTLKIYNLLGQEVATLLDREELTAGDEEVEFDASTLASGVYLYRIVAEEITDDGGIGQTFTQVKKMVLMK